MSFSLLPSFSGSRVTVLMLALGFSACQRPVGFFQRSQRETFKQTTTSQVDQPVLPAPALTNVPDSLPPIAWANAPLAAPQQRRPAPTPLLTERVRQHHNRARQLLTEQQPIARAVAEAKQGPGPKTGQRKTLRELLGLRPRRQLNWWQRISWQLKAATVVILVAVVFAILNITILAIIFGLIGAFLLVKGLKKSFKVRRGIFGLGRG